MNAVVDERTIQELVDRIVKEFHPEKVILFGSRAYGMARPDSDVDLLVILPFEGSAYRMTANLMGVARLGVPVDVVVRRPEDAARRYEWGDPVVRDAFDRGRVLYARAA